MFQEVMSLNTYIALLDKAIAEALSLPLETSKLSWGEFHALAKPLIEWQSMPESEKALNSELNIIFVKLNRFLYPIVGSKTNVHRDIAVFATQKGKIAILTYVIECLGFNLKPTIYHNSLLEYAITAGNLDSIRYLLSHKDIDPNHSYFNQSPFQRAIEGRNDEIALLLVNHPSFKLPNRFNASMGDPLSNLLIANCIQTARHLLAHDKIFINAYALDYVASGKDEHPLFRTILNHPKAQHLDFTDALLWAMRWDREDLIKLILSNPQRKLRSDCLVKAIIQNSPMSYIKLLIADPRIDFTVQVKSELLPVTRNALEYVNTRKEALAKLIGDTTNLKFLFHSVHPSVKQYFYFEQMQELLLRAHFTFFYQEASVSAESALNNLKSKHESAKISVDKLKNFIVDKIKSDNPEETITGIRAEISLLQNTGSALSAFFGASQRTEFINQLKAKISVIQQEQAMLFVVPLQGTCRSLIFSTNMSSAYYRAPQMDSIQKEDIVIDAERVGFFQRLTQKTDKQEKLLHTAEMRRVTNNRL
jgi:hypothetical protein